MKVGSKVDIFEIDSSPYGVGYGEWTAKWWRWAFSMPSDKNPLIDDTGQYCAEGQKGPVWFLAGTTGKDRSADRTCKIEASKSILFPIIASQFSFSEMPSITTDNELIAYTSKDIDLCNFLAATVDGIDLPDLTKYRVRYGPFDLYLTENNIWNIKSGPTKAVSDGFWVFLRPLSKGDHTVSFCGIEPNFVTTITYHITIK